MKRKILLVILLVLLAFSMLFLVSCGKDQVKGTDVKLDGYTKIEDESLGTVFYTEVSSTKLVYSFNDVVEVNKKSTWFVSTDIGGKNTIPSKTVELDEGSNVFFLVVEDKDGNVKQYTLLIKRKASYVVAYYSSISTIHSVEVVEEGDYATPPELTPPAGYHLGGWSYDFSNPITSNVEAGVIWAPNEYTITYDANGGTANKSTQSVKYGTSFSLTTASRSGYTFLGWYKGTSQITAGEWRYTNDVTLIAKWNPNTYSITYQLGGGTNSGYNPSSYRTGDSITLREPTRNGYTFIGWTYSGQSTPTKNVTVRSGEYGNKTYTANWVANEYDVTFDANGGSCSATSRTAIYGGYVSLPTPSRTGYTFLGWYNGSVKVSNGYWTIDRDVTLVAKWEIIYYNITYILNGGTNATENPASYTVNSNTFSLVDPTREGYEFLGWTYTGQSTPTKTVTIGKGCTGNLTFTANWKAKSFTVGFDANGGTCSVMSMDVTYDSYCELPTPIRSGYTFSGWYCNGVKYTSGTCKIAGDITLVAQWNVVDYSISYNLNGGVNPTTNPTSYNILADAVITNPTRTGYTFLGWTYDGQTTPLKDLTIPADTAAGITITAHWTANKYTLTLDANGGAVENGQLSVTYDDAFVLPTPTRAGYTFLGWYNNGTKVTSGTWKIDGDVTLVADWSIITYSISYDMNGGVNAIGNPTSYTVVTGATIANPTRTGYTFLGWTYDDITTPIVDVVIPAGSIDSKGLTAHWSANEYIITLDANGGSFPVASLTVKYNSSFELPVPIDDNYYFAGWYNGDTKVTDGIWNKAENITLTARWDGGSQNLEYSIYSTYCVVIGIGSCSDTNLLIPKEHNGLPVTGIGDRAFQSCTSLESVIIPESVTSVGDLAFSSCTSLTIITIPDSVTSIGDDAFSCCTSLTSVTIPDGVNSIGDFMFSCCESLTSVTIGNSVMSIGENAFSCCASLTSVTIPVCVTSIGNRAFQACRSLTSVTIPDSVTYMGAYVFFDCTSLESVTIGNNVTSIGENAFQGCTSLESVIIGNNVTKIGNWAFTSCRSLTSVTIPDSVTSIGDEAFSDCTSLKSVIIGNSVTKIGANAFCCTSLTSVTIPDSVTSIGAGVFNSCTGLESVTIGNSVTSIGDYAFNSCTSLESVIVGNSVTKIGNWAFTSCRSLTSVTIPDSVTSIGDEAFSDCTSLKSVIIGNSVTKIGANAFCCTSLTSVTIPDSVTSIGAGVFNSCTGLESVTIGNGVTSIGDFAFCGTSITSVTIPDSVKSMGEFVFSDCTSLTNVVIPDSVTYIGDYAFSNCKNLVICCEAKQQPSWWSVYWNNENRPVIWGYIG